MKLAVLSSSCFSDRERLYKILDANIDKIKLIVNGGAKGADSLASEWCRDRGVPCLTYYPKWYSMDGEYHRGAGLKRTYLVLQECDRALVFFTGDPKTSPGTKNSLEIAKQLNKPVKLIIFQPETPKAEGASGEEKSNS